MPKRKRPITQRAKVEDESIGNPPDRRGPHQPWDEGLPGRGGTKGGLNRYSGLAGRGGGGGHRRSPQATGGGKENRGKQGKRGRPEKA